MPTTEVRSERDRLRALFKTIQSEQGKVDIVLQPLFSGQMAIKSAGLVEKSIREILSEYARRNSNTQIKKFIENTVEWENSLNCEKIQKILDRFDPSWWKKISNRMKPDEKEAVDSLKTIRDQLAHGKNNGTGINTINEYFERANRLLDKIATEVIP